MDTEHDLRNLYGAMHHKVTGELLYLMEGLYQNMDSGLGEIALRHPDRAPACLTLLRDMGTKRSTLTHLIAERMQTALEGWFNNQPTDPSEQDLELAAMAQEMAGKPLSHFGLLLQSITQRSANALDKEVEQADMPISPYYISCAFLDGCRRLKFDVLEIQILKDLFERYVLERLGSVYSDCNLRLKKAGFLTTQESQPALSS